jgi:hypothetical protein
MSRLQGKLTYSNVIATVCLFVVLGGGAWAASTGAFHSVGHKQLRPNAVDSRRVDDGTLRRADLANGVLPTGSNGDIPWYVGAQQGAVFLAHDPTEITSVNVPAGRYFVTVSGQLAATQETSGSKPLVDCDVPGASYTESLPPYVAARTISFSEVTFIGSSGKLALQCDERTNQGVQMANTQLDAIYLGAH